MFCQSCGAQINDGGSFCNYCGAAQANVQPQPQEQPVYQQAAQSTYQQPAQPMYQQNFQQPIQPNYQQPVQQNFQQQSYPNYQQPYGQPVQMGYNMTRAEFFKQFISKKSYGYVTATVIIFFISAALSAFIMAFTEDMLGIMDIAVYVTFAILLLTTKHWICAAIPTLYGIVWTFIGLANGGVPTGIVAFVIGASCVNVLNKAEKEYKKYCETHILPDKQI